MTGPKNFPPRVPGFSWKFFQKIWLQVPFTVLSSLIYANYPNTQPQEGSADSESVENDVFVAGLDFTGSGISPTGAECDSN